MQLFFKLGSIDKALPSRGKLTRIAKTNVMTVQRYEIF